MKKEKKKINKPEQVRMGLTDMQNIVPLTPNQNVMFNSWMGGKHLFLHGYPGTGKTLLSMFLGLSDLRQNNCDQTKLCIVRSLASARDIGFLPGNSKEKGEPFEAPYRSICQEIFKRGDAYEILKNHKMIEFVPTSFNRGITISNAIVIVDEVQNMTAPELHTIITRVKNCRLIFSGDIRQNDLNERKEFSGISDFMQVIKSMKKFDFIEFGIDDIVRDPLVKEYIIVRSQMEDAGKISSLVKPTSPYVKPSYYEKSVLTPVSATY